MKKIAFISFAIFYLIIATGLSFNIHYCGNRISSVSIDYKAEKECACGSKKMARNCCKSNSQFVKLNDVHQPGTSVKVVVCDFLADNITPQFKAILFDTNNDEGVVHNPPSSLKIKDPLYIQYRSLIV